MGNGALDLWRDPCDTVRIETDLGRQFQLARNRSGLGSPGPDTGSFRLFGGQLDMIAAIGIIMAFMLLITTVFVVVMAIFGLWGVRFAPDESEASLPQALRYKSAGESSAA